ncbi:hypothetical protein HPB50_023131 [Hyalomma asiaticum]|uniref:Uncharacterized protein n=1 Tax=Hyalomma asiaticum TaxID=266040 RepID=A0ACB7TLZ2_HYAAI|nr:hypothetical protein HPB50_023131 [Hyalomma asiaticum]
MDEIKDHNTGLGSELPYVKCAVIGGASPEENLLPCTIDKTSEIMATEAPFSAQADTEVLGKAAVESVDPSDIEDKALDFDEDKECPQYVPRKGRFYQHDDRGVGGKNGYEMLKAKREDDKRLRKQKRPWHDEGVWCHDMYHEEEQGPKTSAELVSIYGYDIRTETLPPSDRRQRHCAHDPYKCQSYWEDEEAYTANFLGFISVAVEEGGEDLSAVCVAAEPDSGTDLEGGNEATADSLEHAGQLNTAFLQEFFDEALELHPQLSWDYIEADNGINEGIRGLEHELDCGLGEEEDEDGLKGKTQQSDCEDLPKSGMFSGRLAMAHSLQTWQRATPRLDKQLISSCAVYDIHFRDCDLVKEFVHTINVDVAIIQASEFVHADKNSSCSCMM